MYKKYYVYSLAFIILLIIFNLFFVIEFCQAKYSAVYMQAEDGFWELLSPVSPDNDFAYCTKTDPQVFSENSALSNSPISVKALVGVNDATNPGRLTMTVEPLTENIEIVQEERDDGDNFILNDVELYAEWRFTYKIENITSEEFMTNILVFDSFGAELDIKSHTVTYSNQNTTGQVDIRTEGKMEKYFFYWDDFTLAPGESASISFILALGKNPAGKQEYTSCGIYELNSEGTLSYESETPGTNERKGTTFKVEVPCKPYIDVKLSASKIN